MRGWRDAWRLVRLRLLAEVWIGAFVLAALGVFWLQIPDSHVWEFAFSILSACGFLGFFFWFCCWIFQKLLKPAEQEHRWWLRWILLAVVIIAWWLLQKPIDRLFEHRELYAGYWTSRLPHWMRWLRTYERLMALQSWVYFSLRLIVTGLLLPAAIVAGASRLQDNVRLIFRVWSRWWYWVAALVCGWVAFAVSGGLMSWNPRHGLFGEMVSLLIRLSVVFTLDVLLACFVLAVVAVGLRRNIDAGHGATAIR